MHSTGKQLEAFREKKGLSRYKVAINGKIAPGQVTSIESGENWTVNILLGYMHGVGFLDIKKEANDDFLINMLIDYLSELGFDIEFNSKENED